MLGKLQKKEEELAFLSKYSNLNVMLISEILIFSMKLDLYNHDTFWAVLFGQYYRFIHYLLHVKLCRYE